MFLNRKKEWSKKIWIAKRIPDKVDKYGRAEYEKPVEYRWNVQPVSADDEFLEFGQNANLTQKALIESKKYLGEFKEFDLAYLDGQTPEGEKVYGSKANYRLCPPRNQNKCIRIYFEKLIDKK